LVAADINPRPKLSDMNYIMGVSDRIFLVVSVALFSFTAWELWQHYKRCSALHRINPAKWPRIPTLTSNTDFWAKPGERR
jgi:hypothetical protein